MYLKSQGMSGLGKHILDSKVMVIKPVRLDAIIQVVSVDKRNIGSWTDHGTLQHSECREVRRDRHKMLINIISLNLKNIIYIIYFLEKNNPG